MFVEVGMEHECGMAELRRQNSELWKKQGMSEIGINNK